MRNMSLSTVFSNMKTCVGKPLGPSLHTKDPWDFAGDTGSNAYFGTVERMKLGQFWG